MNQPDRLYRRAFSRSGNIHPQPVMHLANFYGPACGASYDAVKTINPAAVTCPRCRNSWWFKVAASNPHNYKVGAEYPDPPHQSSVYIREVEVWHA